MAFTNLPAIFSTRLKEAQNQALVYGEMANRDWEGEVVGGGSVKITQFADVTIGTYDPATGMDAPEQVSNTQQSLNIDQFKYFNFYVDSIEKVQRNVEMLNRHMTNAGNGIAKVQDTFISGLYVNADASNLIGSDATPTAITNPADAYDILVDLGVKLDNQNMPKEDRSVACTPAFVALLRKDPRFTRLDSVLLNGAVGTAAGFTVRETTNAPKVEAGSGVVANTKIIATHKSAITFANQLEELVSYNPESRFGDGVKGLSVYGAKVVDAKGIAVLSLA